MNNSNNGTGLNDTDYEFYHQIMQEQQEDTKKEEPTKEEIEAYEAERSRAREIAIDVESEDSRRRRVKAITSSLVDKNDRVAEPIKAVEPVVPAQEQQGQNNDYYFGKQNDSIEAVIADMNSNPWYSIEPKQKAATREVVDENGLGAKIKDLAWKLAPYIAGGAIFISTIIGGKVVADRIENSDYHTPRNDKAVEQFENELEQDGMTFEERMELIKEHQKENIEMNGNEHVIGYVDETSTGGRSL